MSDLPFGNESFDIVFCTFALMFFADRAAALSEMRRVLKPGGRMAGNPDNVHCLIGDAGFSEVSVWPTMGVVRFPSPEYLARSYGALGEKVTEAIYHLFFVFQRRAYHVR